MVKKLLLINQTVCVLDMFRASTSLEHLSKCGESVRCRFRLSYSSEVEVGSDSEVVGNSEHSTSSAEQSIQPIRTCTCTALLSMLPCIVSLHLFSFYTCQQEEQLLLAVFSKAPTFRHFIHCCWRLQRWKPL